MPRRGQARRQSSSTRIASAPRFSQGPRYSRTQPSLAASASCGAHSSPGSSPPALFSALPSWLPQPLCAVGLPVGDPLSELLLASMGPSGNMLLVITTPTMCHPGSLPSLGPFWELSGAFQERSRALQKLSRAIQGLSGALHGFSGAFRSPPEPSRSSPELSSGCLEPSKGSLEPLGALQNLSPGTNDQKNFQTQGFTL